jgi:hypothetical protein
MEHKHEYVYAVSNTGTCTASCMKCDYVIEVLDVIDLLHRYVSLQFDMMGIHKTLRTTLRSHLGDDVYNFKMEE